MPKSKSNGTKERAAVGRERRIALALRAVLDATAGNTLNGELEAACSDALGVLNELGYRELQGIPTRVARLSEQLRTAVESGNGKEIARLGLELDRAKAGLPPAKVKGEKAKVAGEFLNGRGNG
jgi:hypothetical protein